MPANMVNFQGERLMFDCGEGTQRRLMMDKMGFMDISRVFISHWHADHFSGLLGLIQTLEMEGREEPLYVYGPPRTEEFTERLLDTGYFSRNYDIYAEDLVEGDVVVGDGYEVVPFEVEHGINAFGYVFKEDPQVKANKQKMEELGLGSSPKIGKLKSGESIEWNGETVEPGDVVEKVPGRKVVYSGDTAKCDAMVERAEDAD
ncbi:MAG: MBL fold metallo-hydrolase, partial [Candidatus Aenigmatarchaeota archaeon]